MSGKGKKKVPVMKRVFNYSAPTPPEGETVPEQETPTISEMCGSIDFGGKMKVDGNNGIYFEAAPVVSTAAPEPPQICKHCSEEIVWAHKSVNNYRDHVAEPVAPESYKPAEGPEEILHKLRLGGWMVAVHNDYRLNGKLHTFWLFTRTGREGYFVKGEGETDADALNQIVRQLASHPADTPVTVEAPEPLIEPDSPSPMIFAPLATPKPIGDVEAVAGKLYGQLAYVDIGMVDWLKKAAAILSPFFAPAGPITIDQLYKAAKVMNSGDVRKDLYALEGLALHMHRDTGKMKYLVEALNCRVTLKDFDSKFPDPLAQPPCSECATLRKERDGLRDENYMLRHAPKGCSFCGEFQGHTAECWTVKTVDRLSAAEAQLSTLEKWFMDHWNEIDQAGIYDRYLIRAALAPTPEVAPKE